jgi:hypothetical protein
MLLVQMSRWKSCSCSQPYEEVLQQLVPVQWQQCQVVLLPALLAAE